MSRLPVYNPPWVNRTILLVMFTMLVFGAVTMVWFDRVAGISIFLPMFATPAFAYPALSSARRDYNREYADGISGYTKRELDKAIDNGTLPDELRDYL